METLGLEAMTYSTVTKYHRARSFHAPSEMDRVQDQELSIREFDADILKTLTDKHF
jgi:hypothetical protein